MYVKKAAYWILAVPVLLGVLTTGVTATADSPPAVYHHYFGQLHNHTKHSRSDQEYDPTDFGTPAEACTWARYTAGMDFFAVTDHSVFYYNDMGDWWRPPDYPWTESNPWTFDGGWNDIKSVESDVGADPPGCNDPGNFVAIGAYEMTWDPASKIGHINMFNTAEFATTRDPWRDINPRLNQTYNPANLDPALDFAVNQGDPFNYKSVVEYDPAFTGLQNYYRYLPTLADPPDRSTWPIGQFNHPGRSDCTFNQFDYWTPEIDKTMTLIEVGNKNDRYDYYYDIALSQGWHLAPTNGHDNHSGYPHSDNGYRTVVLAESLTRENIYDALRCRRVYSTEISDFKLTYTVNGQPMGSIINYEMPSALDFEISIDSDKITSGTVSKVTVISGSSRGFESVFTENLTGNSGVSFTLNNPKRGYYYVRIETGDAKRLTLSAPVWIEAPQTVIMRIDRKSAVVNGSRVEIAGGLTPVFSAEGRTMVPFRFLGESLDAGVKWDNNLGSVIVKYRGDTVVVPIDQYYIMFNGKRIPIDAPARLIDINGTLRTFVPLRAVAEILGFVAKYDANTGTIVVSEREIDLQQCVADYKKIAG